MFSLSYSLTDNISLILVRRNLLFVCCEQLEREEAYGRISQMFAELHWTAAARRGALERIIGCNLGIIVISSQGSETNVISMRTLRKFANKLQHTTHTWTDGHDDKKEKKEHVMKSFSINRLSAHQFTLIFHCRMRERSW